MPADSGAHFPRGAPLVTAGGLVFVATAQDRRLRAYDRANGKVLWSKELPSGSEGIPATYEVNGRQFIALPVAAGDGLFRADPAAGRAAAATRLRRVRAAEEVVARGGAQRRHPRRRSKSDSPETSRPAHRVSDAPAFRRDRAAYLNDGYFGGGGLSSAPSQCSSALPSTKRQVSNQVV